MVEVIGTTGVACGHVVDMERDNKMSGDGRQCPEERLSSLATTRHGQRRELTTNLE